MWVLGTEAGHSERTANAFNHQEIPLAPVATCLMLPRLFTLLRTQNYVENRKTKQTSNQQKPIVTTPRSDHKEASESTWQTLQFFNSVMGFLISITTDSQQHVLSPLHQ